MKKKNHYWIVCAIGFVVGALCGTSYYIGKYDGMTDLSD